MTDQKRIQAGRHDVLKPGMSAKVKILVKELTDVKIVPVQVVANRAGKKVCYVVNDKGLEQCEVQTGMFNDTFVEIIEGLEVGEKILLVPPRVVQPGIPRKQRKIKKRRRTRKKRTIRLQKTHRRIPRNVIVSLPITTHKNILFCRDSTFFLGLSQIILTYL